MAIQRALATSPTADSATSTATPTRTGPYGEAYTLLLGGDLGQFADEGSFYIVQTTTPGTGVAGHAAPVQADLSTKPLIHCWNGNANQILIPKYIKVRLTAIGAGATTTDVEVWTETGAGASSRASGGTLMSPSLNTRSDKAADAAVTYFGPVVSTLTSAKRLCHSRVRSVVPVVEDQYTIVFGDMAIGANAGLPTTGTNQLVAVVPMAPIAVYPGHNFQVHVWGASQSGAHSFDLEFGYVAR